MKKLLKKTTGNMKHYFRHRYKLFWFYFMNLFNSNDSYFLYVNVINREIDHLSIFDNFIIHWRRSTSFLQVPGGITDDHKKIVSLKDHIFSQEND